MGAETGRRRVLLDLAAGFVAILTVVGVSVRATFVGSDLRVLIAMTATAFWFAGFARGREPHSNVWLRGVLVSCPGLLGTAALIVNDGLHRLPIPITVSLTAIGFTIAGLGTRREWARAPRDATLLIVAGLCVLALEVSQTHRLVARASLHRTNRDVPAFTLTTFEGDTRSFAGFHGRVVVLAFWASWCLPCRWEMPELDSAFTRVRGDSTVVFLAVDAGGAIETRDRGRRYLARRPVAVPTAYDAGSAAAALGVHALPTVVVLDREGRARFEHFGYDRSEHVDRVILGCIRALEREPGPGATGSLEGR
jgi:thiol-disulfide isomerase/thioredoxin